MEGIRPCPYCGGEVDMQQLENNPYDGHEMFSIRCLKCEALVAKGQGFAGELKAEGEERIRQFKEVVSNARDRIQRDERKET